MAYRRAFDEAHRQRRHYLAGAANGPALGYGALEQQAGDPARFRVYVVTAPAHLETVGAALYAQLYTDLRDLGARVAWTREYRRDEALRAFFKARGFVETALTWDLRLKVAAADRQQLTSARQAVAADGVQITSYADLCQQGDCEAAVQQLVNAIRVEESLTRTVPPLSLAYVHNWLSGPLMIPEACFIARREHAGRVRAVGMSAMQRHAFRANWLVQDFIGLRRAERQPELVKALGAHTLEYARAHDITTFVAYLPDQRAALRAVYEGVGFTRAFGYVSAEKAF